MWSNLPVDLLSTIFSFLSPDSLACAKSVCRHWHTCATTSAVPSEARLHHPAWFLAVPTRSRGLYCYLHNPVNNKLHELSLDYISASFRPIAPIDGRLLVRITNTTVVQLAICNPFTRQFKHLPRLNINRANPAVGIVEFSPSYRVFVAGGMSEGSSRGASYEPTVEMYDSVSNTWKIVGSMPMEFAVRLTVWTPNESVHCNGVLYWITSARAYTVMKFGIVINKWGELSVPMADRLEFAALVPRKGKLALVGGTCDAGACIWELGEDQEWRIIEKVPFELGKRFLGGKMNSTKCVGIDGAVCLYKDLGSGMIVWREVVKNGRWEWFWIEGKKVHNLAIRGLLMHPNLATSNF